MPKKRRNNAVLSSPSSNNAGDEAAKNDPNKKQVLPERHECRCQATTHNLINNCINCGRVVCQAEGSGPCLTCSEMVCTNEEREILMRNSKASMKLHDKLYASNVSFRDIRKVFHGNLPSQPELEKAVAYKERLLDYDRTVERRTRVIDDENDFSKDGTNIWLSEAERESSRIKYEEAHEKKHSRREAAKLTFDFVGRQVVEEEYQEPAVDVDELLKDDISVFDCLPMEESNDTNYRPEFVPMPLNVRSSRDERTKRDVLRIQDKDLQFMSDMGMCLTIQQPYASLLVAGIKRHEGRGWYSSFRGRIWIHAGGKVPMQQDIATVESFYRKITDAAFPTSYPTGCLLGCIDFIDCLTQEQYNLKFPSGEIGSNYVFICENPKELKIKIPMAGRHKIYKLEEKFHQAAKKTLMRL